MKAFTLALLLPLAAFAAAPSNPVLYVTQTPLPDEFLTQAEIIKNIRMSIVSTMQIPLGTTRHAGRGGALWIRYPGALSATNPRNLTAAAGYGGAVDAFGNATGFQGAGSIAVQHPHVHWSGTKAAFAMVVGAPVDAADTTQSYRQLYEITNFGAGQTPVISYVAGQPANYNNMQACYDTQDRLIFVSDAPVGMLASIYPQLDQYNSLPCNTGLWRLDRTTSPAELKQIVHAPSGVFTPFVDSTGRVIFVQWDHLSRDIFASYNREQLGVVPQTFNGNGTFDSETGNVFTLGTLANYSTFNFHPEPRNFDAPALAGTNLNGLAFNHFFPWECREDGSGHETDRHVGRHELGGTQPVRASFKDDPNLVQLSYSHAIALNFLHLTESPTSPGTFFGTNASEFGTHAAGSIVRYTSTATLNPDNMLPTYVTPAIPAINQPVQNPVDLYRNPVPLANGSLLAVHTSVNQFDANIGTATAPLSRYTFRLRTLISNGSTMVPDAAVTMTNPRNVSLSYFVNGVQITYSGAPLWELDPVEVVARTRPAQLTSPIAAIEQMVFDEEGVHAPTYQAHLRANNFALVTGRNVTRRDFADKQQPYNLKVAWSATQTIGAPGKIYDIGWLQFYQADALRAYTHDGQNPAALPAPGRRLMPAPLHGPALAEMPVTPGAPPGAVKIADDGSWAAVVPAARALTWHMLDGGGTKSQVKERMEVSFAAGEARTCAVCHGVNTRDQAGNLGAPQNKPAALRPILQLFKSTHPPGVMQHTSASATFLKSAGTATVSVTRTGGSTGPVSVNFSTSNGTAQSGVDYTAASGTLTWPDGDTAPKTINVPLLNNPMIAADKSLAITLASPLYGTLGATPVNTLTLAEPPFNAWLYFHFGAGANNATLAGDAADPDADSLPNLAEYLLGTPPAAHPDAAPQAASEIVGGIPSLTFTFTRDPSHTGITYHAQVSSDLAEWSDLPDILSGTSGSLEIRKASVPFSAGPQQFLRLKITRP